jgi:hypothetical protein
MHQKNIAGTSFIVSDNLRPDLTRPYVIAVADQSGAVNPQDSMMPPQAHFRIWTIAAITNGYSPSIFGIHFRPQDPWMNQLASALRADGFDKVITYNWEKTSDVASPGLAVAAGDAMFLRVDNAARQLPAEKNDVIDVDFIGHSRGAVVISQALSDLHGTPLRQLSSGYMKMTLLDPHPANNAVPPFYSDHSIVADNPFGVLAEERLFQFQAIAMDPNVSIPASVQEVDDFYQHNEAGGLSGFEHILNLWGESPQSISSNPIVSDIVISDPTVGHGEVTDYFLRYAQSNTSLF